MAAPSIAVFDTPYPGARRVALVISALGNDLGAKILSHFSAPEVEAMRHRTPERGAKVVARAWVDPGFKQRLISNGTKACEELGLEIPALKLVVVENTAQVHNAIVCTLCSCYPRMLLGIPPDWYKSRNYRSRMVREPRKVLREFGLEIPGEVQIRVHDSSADMRYMVLPQRPKGTAAAASSVPPRVDQRG